jgi:hypothetical protein
MAVVASRLMADADRARSGVGGPTLPAWLIGALLVVATPAGAQYFGPPPYGQPLIVVPGYPPTSCYPEVRIFDSLKYGPTTLCRQNMKYRPGRLECFQILDQVCGSYLANGQWFEGRNIATTTVVPCPDGPPQPMCPQLGADGIRDRRSLRYR